MEATLDSLALGFSVAFRPDVLFYAFLGCLVGTLVGVLPGIGPLAGISILLPVTYGLDATKAIVMLAGIYYGSQYGGSTTSILMRIPGEASSVMTCVDGYAMAKRGRAGAALHRSTGARPCLPRLHVLHRLAAHAADGRHGPAARLHRHRRDDRTLSL
jgi:putative tricarboxylic transport membrane protein